jgi:hypothetical protein
MIKHCSNDTYCNCWFCGPTNWPAPSTNPDAEIKLKLEEEAYKNRQEITKVKYPRQIKRIAEFILSIIRKDKNNDT